MHQSDVPRLPTGTVTFLFTDIEGSTRLLERLGDRYAPLLEAHAQRLRAAIAAHDGVEVNTEGDAFFAVFPSAIGAIRAATAAQRSLATLSTGEGTGMRVRMGLHTGEGRLGGDDYVGMDVHRAARIAAAGHGGQVLISDVTRALVESDRPDGVELRDLGDHRLKDLPGSERLWQLEIAGLERDFPQLRSLDARPTNLPSRLSSLVGREEELEAVIDLLRTRRLVTLTGPGGAGKTRLALAAAHRLLDAFPDGVFFVPLEDVRDRAGIVAAIAAALAVRERPDRELDRLVVDYLQARDLLLVLDNFEQLVDAAPLVGELLVASPDLRTIVTSRAVLGLSGEQDYAVPPLGLPDPEDLPPADRLGQYDAVALFIERAVTARSDFRVTNANAPSVAEICSRLDGLPLAIELAAARVRLLSPEGILDRLDRHLPALGGGPRDAPERQRTLERTVDWSFELLREPERRLFARLAVFVDGWNVAAAEAVCDPDGDLGIDVLDGLGSLVDNSLVQAVAIGEGPRFRMLQVIRASALSRLDERSEADLVHRRHALHMMRMAEEAEPELVRTEIRRWQARLRADEENLRAALRWTVDHGETEVGLRLAGSLWHFWHYWARQREGRRWLEAVLAMPDAPGAEAARAGALGSLAALVYWQGDGELASALYEEALGIYRRLGDAPRVAETLQSTAWTAVARRDGDAALDRAAQALEQYRALGDEAGVANVSSWLRVSPLILGRSTDLEGALAAVDVAIEVDRRLGRMHDAADWLGSRAFVLSTVGHPAALDAVREAMRTWDEIGNRGRVFLKLVAAIELRSGHPERAARLGAAAERHREELGGELPEAMLRTGDPVEGARLQLSPESFAAAVETGRRMTLDQAIADALGSTETVPAR